jgi:hypothetical protein
VTTTSSQDINALTAIHIGKTTTGKVSGTGENDDNVLNEQERQRQLADTAKRHGAPVTNAVYPIAPGQDFTGATRPK